MKELLSSASLALLSAHNLAISSIHLDTTAKSVQGACEPDARSAMDKLLKKVNALGFQIDGGIMKEETSSYAHQGRPRKGEQPTVTVSDHASCVIGDIQDEFYDQLKKKESTFILIADVKDKQRYNDPGILLEYKKQISVENKFRFLKSPVYLGPAFLEKPERVHALG